MKGAYLGMVIVVYKGSTHYQNKTDLSLSRQDKTYCIDISETVGLSH